MCQPTFRDEFFLDSQKHDESLFLDRKADLYGLGVKETRGKQRCVFSDKKKADFAKDIIALANTATIFHQPTYLLLGLTDDGLIKGLADEIMDFGYSQKVPPFFALLHITFKKHQFIIIWRYF